MNERRWLTAYYVEGPTINLEELADNERTFPEPDNCRWRVERLVTAFEVRPILKKRAQQLKAEIEQIFIDVAHWNTHVRAQDEDTIDPDPDGALKAELVRLDAVIVST